MNRMRDRIVISKLELASRIGVTDEEQSRPQRLTASLSIEPKAGLSDLRDRIENTVDYAQVCARVKEIAMAKPRHLIETLAAEIADALLSEFALGGIEVELRKYVLPETEFVAVKIFRQS